MSEILDQLQTSDNFSDARRKLRGNISRSLHPILCKTLKEFNAFTAALEPDGEFGSFAMAWQGVLANGDGEAGVIAASTAIARLEDDMAALKESLENFERLRPGILGIELNDSKEELI